jgi:hypothetical protein
VENLRLNDVSNVLLFRQAVPADGRSIVLRCLPSNTGGCDGAWLVSAIVLTRPYYLPHRRRGW